MRGRRSFQAAQPAQSRSQLLQRHSQQQRQQQAKKYGTVTPTNSHPSQTRCTLTLVNQCRNDCFLRRLKCPLYRLPQGVAPGLKAVWADAYPVHRAQLLGGEAADAHAQRGGGQRDEVGQPAVAVPLAAELCEPRDNDTGEGRLSVLTCFVNCICQTNVPLLLPACLPARPPGRPTNGLPACCAHSMRAADASARL